VVLHFADCICGYLGISCVIIEMTCLSRSRPSNKDFPTNLCSAKRRLKNLTNLNVMKTCRV